MHIYVLKVSRTNLYNDEPTHFNSFEGDKLMQEKQETVEERFGSKKKKGWAKNDGWVILGEVT